MVSEGYVRDVTTDLLARDMVGHDVRNEPLNRSVKLGDEVLRLEDLTQEPHYRHISLSVRAGEVLGVTGLLGDGRSEIFRTVFGDTGKYQGNIIVNGKSVQMHSTQQALALGIGYVPRNRKENGIIKDMNILENGSIVTLPRLAHRGLIDRKAQREGFDRQRQELHIKMGRPEDPITSLSGGNQQKVVLAKWLSANPSLLILDNPTQGVDVGAKQDIFRLINDITKRGSSVIYASCENSELLSITDRIYVLYDGHIMAELETAKTNEDEIMHYAVGSTTKYA